MIKIDFSFYIALLLALFSHQIDIYLTYLIAILIHECGHLVLATLFQWRIIEFRVSAIGGFLTFENDLSRPVIQSLIVATGGVIFNLIFGLFLLAINGPVSLIYAQFAIAIFNLLPIAPLDGSRIVQSLLRIIMNYSRVLKVTKVLNVVGLFLFTVFVLAFNLEQYFFVIIVLAFLVGKFHATAPYIYERYKIQKGGI